MGWTSGSLLCNIRQLREAHGINMAAFLTSLQASPANPRLPVLKATTASTCTNSRLCTPSTCTNSRPCTPSICRNSRSRTANFRSRKYTDRRILPVLSLVLTVCLQLYFCADLKRKGTFKKIVWSVSISVTKLY